MATPIYPVVTAENLATLPSSWSAATRKLLSMVRSISAQTITQNTIASLGSSVAPGVTAQCWGKDTSTLMNVGATLPSGAIIFVSKPLNAFTLASLPTFNMRGSELNAMANYGMGAQLYSVTAAGVSSYIGYFSVPAEFGTAEAAQTATFQSSNLPFSVPQGAVLVIIPAFCATGGTSASGYTVSAFYNGNTGASGDCFLSFAETITEVTTTPISGTDANGATTESASIDRVQHTVTDTGTEIETLGSRALADTDNATATETLGDRKLSNADFTNRIFVEQLIQTSSVQFGQVPSNVRWVSQGFTAKTSILAEVSAWLQKVNAPTDNVVIEVQTDNAGLPSGTVIGTVGTIPAASIPASPNFQQITSQCNIPLAAGTTYHLVFRRSGTYSDVDRYNIINASGTLDGYGQKFEYGSGWAFTGSSLTVKIGFGANVGVKQTSISGGYGVAENSANQALAQSFQFTNDFTISDLQLWLQVNGSPIDSLLVRICADNAGVPGTVLGSFSLYVPTDIPVQPHWHQCAGGTISGLSLLANTTYWIQLTRTTGIDAVNYILWSAAGSDVYAGGAAARYNGSTWSQPGNDFAFQLLLPTETASVVTPVAKSGSDSNSGITESAAFSVATTTLDANGATTESTSVITPTPKSDTDTNSTITETGTAFPPQSKSNSDATYAPGYVLIGPTDPSNGSAVGLGTVAANTKIAQSFNFTNLIQQITVMNFWMTRVGSPADNITLEIQTDLAGSPSGVVIASTSQAASGIPSGSPSWVEFATGGIVNASVLPGQTYWFVLSRSGALDAANRIDVWTTGTPYADGVPKRWDGAAWQTDTNDISFRLETRKEGALLVNKVFDTQDANAGGIFGEFGVNGSTYAVGGTSANTKLAQGFQSSAAFTINDLQIYLQRVGSPADNLIVEIQADSAGAPSGTALAQAVVGAASISTALHWHSFSSGLAGFSPTPGTPYWIVVYRSGAIDAANYILVTSAATSVYPDGTYRRWNGSVWGAPITTDLSFLFTVPLETQSVVTITPISGTDTNGVTTESQSVLYPVITVTDTDGANPEVVTLASVIPATDANGATAEAGTAVPQITFVSGTDASGVITEAITLLAKPIPTDANGTTTESTGIVQVNAISSSDTNGTTTEATSIATFQQVSGTDASSTVTEAITQTAVITATDVEGADVEATNILLGATDTNGATTETPVEIGRPIATDQNSGIAEAILLTAVASTADANSTTTDVATRSALIPATDSNSSTTEAFVEIVQITVVDQNSTVTEATSLATLNQIAGSDVNGATTEAFVEIAAVPATDTGTDVEAQSLATTTFISGTDTASASESATIIKGPLPITGLALWFDASQLGLADGAAISPWPNLADASLPGVMVGTPSPKAHTNALNGLEIAQFTANEGRLRVTGASIGADFTLVYVARMRGPTAQRIVTAQNPPTNLLFGWWNANQDIGYDNGNWMTPNTQTAWTTDWKMYSADGITGVRSRLFSDGILLGTNTTPGGWGGTFNISGYNATDASESSDCDVAEVLFYNRTLSAVERQQVESYLRNKWLVVPIPVASADTNSGISETAGITGIGIGDTNSVTTEAIGSKASVFADANGVVAESTAIRITASDSSSVTTESVAMARETADQNSGIVEAVGSSRQVADQNSTTTETVAPQVVIVFADASGVITESAISANKVSVTDTNSTTTEATSLVQLMILTSLDSGQASETASPRYFASGGADTGFGAENASPRFLVAQSDANGTTTEAASTARRYLVADSGTTTEFATVHLIEVGISIDMTHALLGANPGGNEMLSANGLHKTSLLSVNGTKTHIVIRTNLGSATLRGVR